MIYICYKCGNDIPDEELFEQLTDEEVPGDKCQCLGPCRGEE